MPVSRIGKFELLDELGRGGMGVVYRARDTRLRRMVALKVMQSDYALDAGSRARFLRECRAVAALNHPNIATLYEADEDGDGTLFFATELIEGDTLSAKTRRGPLPVEVAISYSLQLAEALAAAHERGIVHRDIKPANLMLTHEGRLKVLDFGLARLTFDEDLSIRLAATRTGMSTTRFNVPVPEVSVTGSIVGTPGYMAPEQIRGEPVGPPADVFAAGVVLFELLTGKTPYRGASAVELLRAVLETEPAPTSKLNAKVSSDLDELIRRCLARDPVRRYQNGSELRAALLSLGTVRRQGRHGWIWGSAGMTTLLIVIGLLWIQRPTLAFGSRDRVLLAHVVNQTSQPVLGDALGTALEVDLNQSEYAQVVGRRQIAEALDFMRVPMDTPLDLELALEIARWSGAKAVVAPSIKQAGGTYRLEATLYSVQDAAAVDGISVVADDLDAVLRDAVDELTATLRGRLGESLALIESTDEPIVKVTTASWEALDAIQRSVVAFDRQRFAEAAGLLEEALKVDPACAAAKVQLGLIYLQSLGEPERGKALLLEGAASDRLSRYESFMTRALVAQYVDGNFDSALEQFRVAAELFPARSEPHQNQAIILRGQGRFQEAAAAFREVIARSPNSTLPLSLLWFLQVGPLRDPTGAEETSRRTLALRPGDSDFSHMLAWSFLAQLRFEEAQQEMSKILEAFPEHELARSNSVLLAFRQGKLEDAVAGFTRLLTEVQRQADPGGEAEKAFWLGVALKSAGRLVEAETNFDRARQAGQSAVFHALVDAARGRTEDAVGYLSTLPAVETLDGETAANAAAAFAYIGDTERALEHLDRALSQNPWDVYYKLILPQFQPLWQNERFTRLIVTGSS